MSVEVGGIVEGVVTGVTHFGAFVELPNGKTGLVHISEIADTFVRNINDFVKPSDRVKVKILAYDDKGKIGLSIRQAQPGASAVRGPGREERRFARLSFEDKLQRFLKESEDKLSTLRRNTDNKRGGRGTGRGKIAF